MFQGKQIQAGLVAAAIVAGVIAAPIPSLKHSDSQSLLAQTFEEDWALAQRLYQQRDIYNTFSVLNSLLKRKPKFAPAHDLRGIVLLEMGNPQGGYESTSRAIDLDPRLATAYAHRGQTLANMGDISGAIADFDQAIALDSTLGSAYFERANTHLSLGNYQKAIADYSSAIQNDSKLASAYGNRGAAYMTVGNTEQAIADYSKALRLKPQITYPILANRSEAYSIQKNYKAALEDADQAIRLAPRYSYGYIAKGAALTGLEDFTGAEVNFARAIQLESTDGYAYYWRGLLRLKKGEPKLAILDYEEALRLNPDIAKGSFENYSLLARKQTEPTVASTPSTAANLYNIAKDTTVLIDGQNSGSGVIFARNGNTYYVLTARHVVATPDEYIIVTPSGKESVLDYSQVTHFDESDLAVISFTSTEDLAIASFGRSEDLFTGEAVYVSGWPAVDAAITKPSHLVTTGNIAGIREGNADGYELLYSNSTGPGMSGGPVFNQEGQVIGIHGRASGNATSGKTGINLGIPVQLFIEQSSKTGVNLQSMGVTVTVISSPVK